MSFKISLSFSPATVSCQYDAMKTESNTRSPNVRTSFATVPIHDHWAQERVFALLELPQCITGACGVLDHAARMRWTYVVQDAAQLIGRWWTLLHLYMPLSATALYSCGMFPDLAPALTDSHQYHSISASSRTELEIGSLLLALLAVITGLVLCSMCYAGSIELLEQCVNARRCWKFGVMEESHDVLDASLPCCQRRPTAICNSKVCNACHRTRMAEKTIDTIPP